MKGKAVVMLAGLCLAGVVAWRSASQPALAASAPALVGTTADSISSIQRGAQLAALGDCVVCHTAKGGVPFAGGLPIHTPFGTLYATNITPDPRTGIGNWSLEAFTRAMRRGVANDGRLLYPAFPYVHFTHMSDADIASVYAFLMSRTPVEATAPANQLIFPLNIRPLLLGWNLLFLHADTPVPRSPTQDARLDRGRYLVETLGHCSACHTPLNPLGAEKRGEAFSGAVIDGWDAPSLTTLLRAPTPWNRDQLASYLRTGLASEHGAAAGPMLPVTRSLAHASDSDVQAMATYIMSLQTHEPAPPSPPSARAGSPSDAASMQAGAVLFKAACAACHAASAPMSTLGERPSLSQSTALNSDSPRNTIRLMLDGLAPEGSMPVRLMPPFAAMLTDEQMTDLARYLRAQYSTRPPWALDASDVAKYRKETPAP
jgi:mono/diheme cytochrome c family protein